MNKQKLRGFMDYIQLLCHMSGENPMCYNVEKKGI